MPATSAQISALDSGPETGRRSSASTVASRSVTTPMSRSGSTLMPTAWVRPVSGATTSGGPSAGCPVNRVPRPDDSTYCRPRGVTSQAFRRHSRRRHTTPVASSRRPSRLTSVSSTPRWTAISWLDIPGRAATARRNRAACPSGSRLNCMPAGSRRNAQCVTSMSPSSRPWCTASAARCPSSEKRRHSHCNPSWAASSAGPSDAMVASLISIPKALNWPSVSVGQPSISPVSSRISSIRLVPGDLWSMSTLLGWNEPGPPLRCMPRQVIVK
jgi:hypothetical protein